MSRHLHAVRVALAAAMLAALLLVGARPVGPAPALGPLLDPAHGAWSLARTAEHARDASARIPGVRAPVEVRYDDRGVPHVFAANLEDAWRAMGYVVARDRLFQLELQTIATEGRLTEIAGPRALPLDREMRLLGLAANARARYAALPAGGISRRAVDAYAAGVNAYIAAMPAAALPLEYRLLGRRPARWEPWHSVLVLNRMGWTLSYNEGEIVRDRVAALVGREAADALFPRDAPIQEPIEPAAHAYPRVALNRLPPPGTPEQRSAGAVGARGGWRGDAARLDAGDALGSNSWAVAPPMSRTGHAILAGDPHLALSLPSVWYEMHVVVPDTLDVYGATIPGAPTVIIGFNRDAAWTYTNVESDVLDRYVEEVDSPAAPTRYRLDGEWRPLRTRVEQYRDAAGTVVQTDTFRHTHRGPMELVDGRWLSLRWTLLESGDDLRSFLDVSRARSVAEYLDAMRDYQSPAQNMLVADRAGSIAIRSTGRFPLRPTATAGMALQPGQSSAADWRGDVPVDRYPRAVDPEQAYLASANQQPRDPNRDSTYFGADWYAPWRAMQINRLLRFRDPVGVDDMRRMQTDPGSVRADLFVHFLLGAARGALARPRPDSLALREAVALLGEWDRRYTRDNRRAILFELAMTELQRRTWDELRPPDAPDDRRVPLPNDMALLALFEDSASAWWDDRATPAPERRDDIVAASLLAALAHARDEFGDPRADGWRWDRIRHANIHHLLRIPALSALDVPVQGGPSTLAPSSGSGTAGPSWRMVVELGDVPAAWTIYPGGQSGNPLSTRYRDRVGTWSDGRLEPALVPRRPADLAAARTVARLTFAPAP